MRDCNGSRQKGKGGCPALSPLVLFKRGKSQMGWERGGGRMYQKCGGVPRTVERA